MGRGPFERLAQWLSGRRSERRWHAWDPGRPVMLTDGTMSVPGRGRVWRRRAGDTWEYEQDDGFDANEDVRNIDWD
jgi:hypothetical protein